MNYQDFLSQHVDNFHSDHSLSLRPWHFIPTCHIVGFLARHIGQRNVERLAIIRRVNHDAIDHRSPIVNPRLEQARLLLQTLDDGRGDEVFNLDEHNAVLPGDLHLRRGRLMFHEFAILGIGTQFNHCDAIHGIFAFTQPVPILNPCLGSEFYAETNDSDGSILILSSIELSPQFFKVERSERMAEWDDLDQLLAKRAIKVGIRASPLYADVLTS
jgi:hypothetical protein